jgi:hypothetical protein
MDGNVLKSIEQLRCLTVNGLREKYQEIFGENSRSGNKDYLYRRMAFWRSVPAVARCNTPTTPT